MFEGNEKLELKCFGSNYILIINKMCLFLIYDIIKISLF